MENKTTNQQMYEKCLKYLDITFLDSELKSLVNSNENFNSLILKMISIISYYETNKIIEANNLDRLIMAYSTVTKSNNFEELKTNFKDELDFEEILGFYPILITNILGKSIDDIEKTMKGADDTTAPLVESEVVDDTKEQKEEPQVDNNTTGGAGFNFNKNGSGFFNQHNMSEIADAFVLQAADGVLRYKVAKGEVYKFVSKPKIIPILKYITATLFMLIAALMICSIGILAAVHGRINVSVTVFHSNPNGSITTSKEAQPYYCLDAFSIMNLLIYLLIIGMIIYSLVKNNKNENVRFRFNWGWIAFYLGMALIMILMDAGSKYNPVYHWDQLLANINETTQGPDVQKYINMLLAHRGLQYSIFACMAAILICIILGAIFNPKVDIPRMQELVQQYADDIRNGRLDFDQNNSFGSRFGNGFF